MFRLAGDLARNRELYPAPLVGAPAAVVIDIPDRMRGPGLSLGRYYVIVLETEAERAELELFFLASREHLRPPDLLDRRLSMLRSDHVVMVHYEPPASG